MHVSIRRRWIQEDVNNPVGAIREVVWWESGRTAEIGSATTRNPGLKSRTQDRGSRTEDPGLRTKDPGLRIQDTGFRIQDTGPQQQDQPRLRNFGGLSKNDKKNYKASVLESYNIEYLINIHGLDDYAVTQYLSFILTEHIDVHVTKQPVETVKNTVFNGSRWTLNSWTDRHCLSATWVLKPDAGGQLLTTVTVATNNRAGVPCVFTWRTDTPDLLCVQP